MTGVASDFQVFHELMARKIREILLVASPYDAFIMEEDGSLATRIIDEYQGLNLSHPPRLQRVSSAGEALAILELKKFDLVLTMPNVDDMDAWSLGRRIKKINPRLPVVLLAHSLPSVAVAPERAETAGIDHFFIWLSDPSLLLAIVKNVEDHLNVARDTEKAGVRVLILVEDSPHYLSCLLPLLYSEVVKQTQAVLSDSLNDEHRLLKMRARPKILAVPDYEEAVRLFNAFRPYVFGVIADGRFPCKKRLDGRAGLTLLKHFRKLVPDLPLLLLSAEPANREQALQIPAVFADKHAPTLAGEIHEFFLHHLGFGDFVFRQPDGTVVDWADNLRSFEEKIAVIPEESLLYHASRNHFSNWIMARSEVDVASRLHTLRVTDFASPQAMRSFLLDTIHRLRIRRQKGIVAQFSQKDFDGEIMDFVKIGKGSLGGKARGIAFMANQLAAAEQLAGLGVPIRLPRTMVIAADGYEAFCAENNLQEFSDAETDAEIAARFLAASLPAWLLAQLQDYLGQATGPLSIRSSSLQEDAQFKPYAGLYSTYMLPNNHPDFAVRLAQFLAAVKLVYASTCFAGPRAYSQRLQSGRSSADRMAVIVQQLVGSCYDDYFYPALAGVAQSHNFYPVTPMQPEDGVAHIALGFGRTVVEGERSLRFSPRYPEVLPHFSTVDDVLANAQRFFYALRMKDYPLELVFQPGSNLARREISEAADELPVQLLSSSYIADEHRIRDSGQGGVKVLTFARLLKYQLFPLARYINEVLEIGRRGMGCPVEIEFAVNLNPDHPEQSEFYFLQLRPMAAGTDNSEVRISEEEMARAFCVSSQGLGHGRIATISDIVYVDPGGFAAASTREIAREISQLNRQLQAEGRSYLLAGPGRWGSADRWLGIPVQWQDISAVGAMIELRNDKIKAEPSQGTHFFHNISSMGIPYITVSEGTADRLDWQWLKQQLLVKGLQYVRHVRCARPIIIKIDGRNGRCVMLKG